MTHDIKITRKSGNSSYIYVIDGVVYDSKTLPINTSTIRTCRNRLSCSTEEALDILLCKQEDKRKRMSEQNRVFHANHDDYYSKFEFIYNGVTYKSFSQACIHLSRKYRVTLNISTINEYVKNHNVTKQEAISYYLNKQLKKKPI
jgi:hypothetical protein